MGTVIAPSYASIGTLNLTYQEDSGVYWVMQTLQGLGASQGTLALMQKPRSAGAWAGSSFATAATIVITGTVDAPTAALALDALDRLNAAASLSTTPLAFNVGGQSRFFNVRRDGAVMETWFSALAFSYSIQFAAMDPRQFGTPLTGNTHLPSSSGGLQWPHAWPEAWSATTNSGTVSLTNPGTATGPVVLRIDGPVQGPQIAHTSGSNSSIVTFSASLTLAAGEWLTINMDTRQALANDQSSRAQYITSRGWSGFDPGVNTWAFAAAAYNSSALMTVTATPAWIG